ncbi:MAG TPA: hypothetical protein DEQ23_01130 [Chlorobium sp.]|nr:hypothetical protein [Chlorobium sp.]
MPLLALLNKGTIRIYVHIDQNHPQLEDVAEAEERASPAMGYRIEAGNGANALRMGSQALKTKTF